ncbi:probable LRR receptor-like serine/threonine-protein kinase At3g47570 [Eucalyptus grandis]|uniref:probable LRR receptor-like serine/threonine-protein kinase At3g47570 n=1 Tax=Eucalyptus grandis TaxID=71139 RepID=UPI00192EBB6B|nr:probable LRR receptor-like serine/threonine-protein kinase At3g47570 [Eucalyptus grandis]
MHTPTLSRRLSPPSLLCEGQRNAEKKLEQPWPSHATSRSLAVRPSPPARLARLPDPSKTSEACSTVEEAARRPRLCSPLPEVAVLAPRRLTAELPSSRAAAGCASWRSSRPTHCPELLFSSRRSRRSSLRPSYATTSAHRSLDCPPPALPCHLSPDPPHLAANRGLQKMGMATDVWPVLADFPAPDARPALRKVDHRVVLVVLMNNFKGLIPSYLEMYQSLTLLDLSSNNLSGPIIFPMVGSLIYLNLSWNCLSGVLPMEIGNLKHLNSMDVSGNILDGEIPSSLGNCDGLVTLRMRGNLFHGSIPQSINSLRGLEVLDLSNNNFYGEIPKFLEAFQFLENLNLSYNHLEGPLPIQGVLGNVSVTFVTGNEKLCGGMPEFGLPKCISRNSKSGGVIHKLKITIAVVFGLLGITLVVTFLYLCWLKQKRNEPTSSGSNISLLNLSYGTLLKATDGFSSTNLIGVGSFGSVYKGLLQENGNVIAVKVLNLTRHGALKSFKAECEALKSIKHRNLLKVLTVCSGVDYKGDEFKALVYEFMVNGNLEEWLHPNPAPNNADGHSKKLSFLQRISISIDVAFALDYLHNQCEIPIIHCDLKPSNILLDADMVGHVGDFGLAKIVLESTFDTRASMSSIGLRGTIGYAAPEYAYVSQVSREGDVYSYGVLLLEMFTGLSPTSDMLRENLSLHNYVDEALPLQAMEITDPGLFHEGESHSSSQDLLRERNHIFHECLETIYRIGLACSMEEPRRRVSMDKVATQLCLIRKKLFAASLVG